MYRHVNPADTQVPLWHIGLAYEQNYFYSYLHIKSVFPLKSNKLIFLKF